MSRSRSIQVRMQERAERVVLPEYSLDKVLVSELAHAGLEIDPRRTRLWRNLSYEEVGRQEAELKEGEFTSTGAFAIRTGVYTGRSPKDRFFVRQEPSQGNVDWGVVNQPTSPEVFRSLRRLIAQAASSLSDIFIYDGYVGGRPETAVRVRIITETANQHHFAKNMFVDPQAVMGGPLSSPDTWNPELTIISIGSARAENYRELNLHSEAFVVYDLDAGLGLIGGTLYCGEIKKGAFTVMNYRYPSQNILSMHCSATKGKTHEDDTVLFFGLSGTGKTTLSADPTRLLIGDDEHGWDDTGIFNLEAGCYAKVINLKEESEPDIYHAIKTNALLENVIVGSDGVVDLSNASITENTRCSYPLTHIENATPDRLGSHPHAIVFLTCDVYGVLPPVARLTPGQAMFHFMSGYSSKMAGTERGIKEPSATFSPCFGGAFMPRNPTVYANLLREKIEKHNCAVYLVNTGWSGGSYGQGHRMSIHVSRAIVTGIVTGALRNCSYNPPDKFFNLETPAYVDGVESHILNPRRTWSCEWLYDATAEKVANLFQDNWKKCGYPSEWASCGVANKEP